MDLKSKRADVVEFDYKPLNGTIFPLPFSEALVATAQPRPRNILNNSAILSRNG
jgi:hypothetical protein